MSDSVCDYTVRRRITVIPQPPTVRTILRGAILGLHLTLNNIEYCRVRVPVDIITENTDRIFNVLQEISDKNLDTGAYQEAINDFLSIGPFAKTEVPIDVLNRLISVGFEMNHTDKRGRMCLDIAVERHHYNVVRLLVKHGARSGSDTRYGSVTPPIISLASQPDVPLDLFDLFVAHINNSTGRDTRVQHRSLPLHEAVSSGNLKTALYLIKLGASVDKCDESSNLPIEYAVQRCTLFLIVGPFKGVILKDEFELFMSLLPRREYGVHILRPIVEILHHEREESRSSLFEVLHQLIQRLHFNEPLTLMVKISIKTTVWSNHDIDVQMVINNDECRGLTPLVLYLCSLILIELQFDFDSTPRNIAGELEYLATLRENIADKFIIHQSIQEGSTYLHATDDLWRNYAQQSRVKSLLRLCILRTRSSMSTLDDESFLSLPVPPYIRKLLTYRDVSEKLFEEWNNDPILSS